MKVLSNKIKTITFKAPRSCVTPVIVTVDMEYLDGFLQHKDDLTFAQ